MLFVRLLDFYKFDGEDKGRERLDALTLRALAVSQLLRNIDLPLRTFRHVYKSVSPSLDYLVATHCYRFAALVA